MGGSDVRRLSEALIGYLCEKSVALLFLIANLVTTSKALAPSSDAQLIVSTVSG